MRRLEHFRIRPARDQARRVHDLSGCSSDSFSAQGYPLGCVHVKGCQGVVHPIPLFQEQSRLDFTILPQLLQESRTAIEL